MNQPVPGASGNYFYNSEDLPTDNRINLEMSAANSAMMRGYWRMWQNDPTMLAIINKWISYAETGANPDSVINGFITELENTEWYQSSSSDWRDAEDMKWNDPGTWAEQMEVYEADIRMMSESLGYSLSDQDIIDLADEWGHYNWTDAEIEREIINIAYYEQDDFVVGDMPSEGTVRDEYNRIKEYASQMFVTVSDDWAWRMANNVVTEQTTGTNVDSQVRDIFKTQYDHYDVDKVDGWGATGTTASDAFAPVLQAVRTTLGDSSIGFDDEWFQNNMTVVDEDGDTRFITQQEAVKKAQRDERFLTTDKHVRDMKDFSNAMMRVFGVR